MPQKTKNPVDIYGWHPSNPLMIPLTNEDHAAGEADPNPPVQAQREPSGPVGPIWGDHLPMCNPCGHTWSEHDDQGCLWNLCQCPEPGERQ